jgi:hypothetical protein
VRHSGSLRNRTSVKSTAMACNLAKAAYLPNTYQNCVKNRLQVGGFGCIGLKALLILREFW